MAGFRNLEFLLRERVRVGLQAFRDDPTLVDRLFRDLSPDSCTQIKDWLQQHEVSVLLGYPRGFDDLPSWTLSMQGESKFGTPIGEEMEHAMVVGLDEQDDKGEFVIKQYQMMTLTTDPDLTLILATILQQILKSMRLDLDLEGFHQMTVAQTDAVSLQLQYLPNFLYLRTTAISVIVQDSILFVNSTLPKSIDLKLNVALTIPTGP